MIQSYPCTEVNLRKAIHKIADNAAVERWPKPLIALRASRRTEFGHTGKIAETYYLQTTEADFELAADSGPIRGPH